jgi:hypothetical protein
MLLVVVALAGCAQVPEQVKQATETAMGDATTAGADKYATESLAAAQALLDQAKAEEAAQTQKFALLRSYKKQEELLTQAKSQFEKAKEDAAAGMARAKAEADQLIAEAKAGLDAADAILAKAPMGKDTRADIEAMKNDVATYRMTITEAEGAMTTEDYLGAKAKAESVKMKAAEIESQVQAAMEKVKAKRGR